MSPDHQTTATASANVFRRYQGNPAEIYERWFVPAIGLPFATRVVDAADLHPGERVLDVACGTGVVTRLAAERVGVAGEVAGIDGHPGMLEVARDATPPESAIEWRQASADGLPFQDASFDVAVSSISLQFFADKVRALGEMRRVLVPGGRVAIGVPGPTPPLFDVLHEVLADHLGAEVAAFVHGVFALDDPTRLEELLAAAGFDHVRVEVGPLPVRLDAPADFLWQYLLGTPLADAVANLDQQDRDALQGAVVRRWAPFVVDDHMPIDVGCLVATGR